MKNFLKNMFTKVGKVLNMVSERYGTSYQVEILELMSNWRLVLRLLMVVYGWAFLDVINWFMALENTNNAQAGLVSVVVGVVQVGLQSM